MKYVVFEEPDKVLDGLDWVYDLIEGKKPAFTDFFLVNTKNPEVAREKVAAELYKKDKTSEYRYIEETAFWGLCNKEWKDDDEIIEYFGEEDGKTILGFYDKYTWDAFYEDKLSLYESYKRTPLEDEDREKFINMNEKSLEKLYKYEMMHHLLVMPITKELK